jgi:hypothetical protein
MCYRVAIDADVARAALGGPVPEWWQPKARPAGSRSCLYKSADGRTVATYPLRHFEALNISAVFPMRPKDDTTRAEADSMASPWHTAGDKQDMAAVFADFPSEIRTLIR